MRKNIMLRSVIVGIVVLFVGASVGSAFTVTPTRAPAQMMSGNTLYVGGSGPGNYTTIQAAINNATNGNTIFVYNNTYNENIDTKLKRISLVGEQRDITFIKGQTTDPVVKIGTSYVNISGFTIMGTSPEIVLQVASLAQNIRIFNNIILDGGYGISLQPTTSLATITGNTIMNQAFIGIELQTSSNDVISFNIVSNGGGQGIALSLNSNHNSILNNSVVNNVKEGILLEGSGSTVNTISGNNVSGNQVGIRFNSAGSNTVTENNIQGNAMEGLLLQLSKENTINMNNFNENKRQATFKFSSRNTWDANYWSSWIGFKASKPGFQKFPKFIIGIIGVNIDKNPAKQLYNITGFP
jgi:parallel beta-helix repeat protein